MPDDRNKANHSGEAEGLQIFLIGGPEALRDPLRSALVALGSMVQVFGDLEEALAVPTDTPPGALVIDGSAAPLMAHDARVASHFPHAPVFPLPAVLWSDPEAASALVVASAQPAARQAAALREQEEALTQTRASLINLEESQNEHWERAIAQQAELVRYQEATLSTSKNQQGLLYTLGQQIRLPLNGLLGMTEALLKTSLSEEQKAYAEAITYASEGLQTIFDDLLDFSRLEAGGLELDTRVFDLHALISEVAERFARHAENQGLTLAYSSHPDVPQVVEGDPQRIRRVLANLLDNAVKFTPSGAVGLLVRHAFETAHRVCVQFVVRDTGVGISPEKQVDLFNVHDPSTGDGSGLGLTIARQLVEMMGGEIQVDSTPGEGTAFTFTLFLKKVGVSPPFATSDLQGLRVLVLDPVELTRSLMVDQLDSWGVTPVAAEDSQEALQILTHAVSEHHPYAAVIITVDTLLEDEDPIQRMRRITAVSSPEFILQVPGNQQVLHGFARQAGIRVTLSQPAPPSQLQEVLEEIARGRLESFLASLADDDLLDADGARLGSEGDLLQAVRTGMQELLHEVPPELFVELIEMFLEDMPERFTAMREVWQAGDAAELEYAAHTIKGSCYTIGLAFIAARFEILENLAATGELQQAGRVLEEVETLYHRVLPMVEGEKLRVASQTVSDIRR